MKNFIEAAVSDRGGWAWNLSQMTEKINIKCEIL